MKNIALLVAILLIANAFTSECSRPKTPELNVGEVVVRYPYNQNKFN